MEMISIRQVRRPNGPNQSPVQSFKEHVPLDLHRTLQASNSLSGILHQKLAYEVLNFDHLFQVSAAADPDSRKPQRLFEDVYERFLVVFAFERRRSVKHFVEKHTQSPPVHRASVALPGDNFRSQVLVRSHEGLGPSVERLGYKLRVELFGYGRHFLFLLGGRETGKNRLHGHCSAGDYSSVIIIILLSQLSPQELRNDVAFQRQVEVRKHDMSVLSHQHVFRLQVPVNDPHHVEVL